MTGDHDIFDSEVPEAPQTTEGVSPEAPTGPARDEQGRFAAKDQGDMPEAPASSAPPAPAEKTRDVPLSALLDERDKRKAIEAELAHYRRQQSQQQKLPDPIEDAEGYHRALSQQFEQARIADRLQLSQFLAEEKFGADVVAEAMAFFDGQPRAVSEQFLRERSPFHAAVAWFQRHKQMEERSAPDFEAKLRAKIEAEVRAQYEQSPPSTRPVPRSLASAGGAGREPPSDGKRDPLFD